MREKRLGMLIFAETNVMNPLKRIQKAIDRLFLRRLERVLNENVLSADILFDGRIGGSYDYIMDDSKRGYSTATGFSLHHNRHGQESRAQAKTLDHGQEPIF